MSLTPPSDPVQSPHDPRDKSIFENELTRIGSVDFKPGLECQIYAVRLGRLLSQSTRALRRRIRQEFGLKRARDLIHTVCALYDSCLPDIGAQSVYDCVTAHKAFTVLVIKTKSVSEAPTAEATADELVAPSEYESEDCLDVIMQAVEENDKQNRPLKKVFSDSSDDGDDESDSDVDQEDSTAGVRSFLDANALSEVAPRKRLRIIEGLVACATLERVTTFQLPGQDERVIDLQLLSVRRKYRGAGMGKYLVNLAQNRALVGPFDAVVTCADTDAVEFYEKHSFSVDPIINSRYAAIGDIWTNTVKMCYIPPYVAAVAEAGGSTSNAVPFVEELTLMERDFGRWQKLMFGAYQSHARLFLKLKHEVFALKASLCAKESLIDDLKVRNEILERQNRLLRTQLRERGAPDDNDDDQESLADLVAKLESLQP